MDEWSELPYISVDVPWAAIRRREFEVREYVALAESGEGQDILGRAHVRSASTRLPYALLEVECVDGRPVPWATKTALFPVAHREDFQAVGHAMTIVDDASDVVVIHSPIKFPWYVPFKNAMPTLIVYVTPKDRREKYPGETSQEFFMRVRPRWTYEPLVERFKGRWLYVDD